MTNKLKTLKDFEDVMASDDIADLKAEAIKFIKGNDLSDFWEWMRNNKGFDYFDDNKSILSFINGFIEWFFNLTQEDLK